MRTFERRSASRTLPAILALFGAIALGGIAPGCASRRPASVDRLGAAIDDVDIQWPPRDAGWSDGAIVADGRRHRFWLTDVSYDGDGRWSTVFRAVRARLARATRRGQGVLAEVAISGRRGRPDPATSDRLFLFYSSSAPRFPAELLARAGREGPRAGGAGGVGGAGQPLISPVRFILHAPITTSPTNTDTTTTPARGVALVLTSMGDPQYEGAVIDELHRRGWTIITSAFPAGLLFTIDPGPEVRASPAAFAAFSADALDERLREWAYGSEAILDDLAETRPDLGSSPLVLVGFSAGALGLPAIAARLEGRVDAAVLVGGGADIFRIVQTSPLFRNAADLRWSEGEIEPELLDELSREYLARSGLDPHHTAAALRRVPVLQLHASLDQLVPASTGAALYERLGRPERWSFPLGHQLMFWRLPEYAGEIADWVEAAVRESPGSGDAAASEPAAPTAPAPADR